MSEWHEFPKERPEQNDCFLIYIDDEVISGFDYNNYLIARYNTVSSEWRLVGILHPGITQHVKAWCEIPLR